VRVVLLAGDAVLALWGVQDAREAIVETGDVALSDVVLVLEGVEGWDVGVGRHLGMG
jgi:hypothetical protein